jgi:hypothetical protein
VKEPEHRPVPAFEQARDERSAWREKQKTLLSEEQRARYDALRQEAQDKQDLRKKELEDTRAQRINDEKNRLLQHRPHLALRMLPLLPVKERIARNMATHTIKTGDAAELGRLENDEHKRTDKFLEKTEQDRQRREYQRADLSRYFTDRAGGPRKDGQRDRDDHDRER